MLIYMGPYYGYQANVLDKHGNAYYEKYNISQLEINEIHKEEANVHHNRHAQG
jgi:hypothetical protein